jgi:hypothetical protein
MSLPVLNPYGTASPGGAWPPFAANDPSLVVNLYPLLTAANTSAIGLVNTNSGTFDATRGFRVKSNSSVGVQGIAVGQRVQLGPSGTIFMEVDRTAMSADYSQSTATAFVDSSGRPDSGVLHYLLQIAGGGDYLRIAEYGGQVLLYYQGNGSGAGNIAEGLNSSNVCKDYEDASTCQICVTWNANGDLWLGVDGFFVNHVKMSPLFAGGTGTNSLIYNFWIGAAVAGGSGYFGYSGTSDTGDYAIRSCQISTKYVGPILNGPLVGILGDSFWASGYAQAPINETSAATIMSSNSLLNPGTFSANASYGGMIAGSAAINCRLQALAWKYLGIYFPILNVGYGGEGWKGGAMTGSNGQPPYTGGTWSSAFTQANVDLLISKQPEIFIGVPSVNDVGAAWPNAATDTLAMLSYIEAGYAQSTGKQYPRKLRQIIMPDCFAWTGNDTSPAKGGFATQAQWQANYITIRDALRTALTGATIGSRNVPVTQIKSDQQWRTLSDGVTQDPQWLYRIISMNPNNTVANSKDGGGNCNPHPSCTGGAQIANILWPSLKMALSDRAVRSLY